LIPAANDQLEHEELVLEERNRQNHDNLFILPATTSEEVKMVNHQPPMFNEQETLRKYSMIEDDNESTGTYAQMVEEVEKVSDLLQETRATLRETQNKLHESEKQSKLLELQLETEEREMQKIGYENDALVHHDQRLREEVDRLREEVDRLEKAAAGDNNNLLRRANPTIQDNNSLLRRANPTIEDRLRKAVELLNKELTNTREKLQVSQIQSVTQKSHIESLDRSNRMLKTRNEQMGGADSGELGICQGQLKEAQLEASDLLEEVAKLRDELSLQKSIAEEKEFVQIEDFEATMKGKIRVEERGATTKLLTRKIRKEVTAEVSALKEKEMNQLREEFRKVFKEKEVLRDKIYTSRAAVKEAEKLEQEAPRLKFEVTRLLEMLEATGDDSAAAISELESNFRLQIHAMQEKHAREKWTHISEFRTQWSKEREKETTDYGQRMEVLAEETSRLLKKAENEKEEYAIHVKKRVEAEKQVEIDALRGKLKHITKEAEDLLEDAAQDNETYASQIRKEMEDERHREMMKHKSRIEILERENKILKSRAGSLGKETRSIREGKQELEKEISSIRKEKNKFEGQLKPSELNLKAAKGEVFNLKRKNEVLRNNVERYKRALDEKVEELEGTKESCKNNISKHTRRQNDQEIDHLKAQVESHKESNKQFDAELYSAEEEIYKLRAEIESLDLALTNAKSEIENLNFALSNSTNEFQERLNNNDRAKEELKDSQAQVSSLKAEIQQLHNEMKRIEQSHGLMSKELEHSKRLFNKELVKSEQNIFRLKERVEVLTQSQRKSSHIQSETRQLYVSLVTAEKRNKEQIDLLESLLSRAARESLKISKRLHECDRHFRLFLTDIDEERMKDKTSITIHAADAESTSKGNIKLSQELQSTMRQLKETLLCWKNANLGLKGELDTVKSKFSVVHQEGMNSSQISSVEVTSQTQAASRFQDENTASCTKLPVHLPQDANMKGILKLPSSDSSEDGGDGTPPMIRKKVSWRTTDLSILAADEVSVDKKSRMMGESEGAKDSSIAQQRVTMALESDSSSSGKTQEPTSSCMDPPGTNSSKAVGEDVELIKQQTEDSEYSDGLDDSNSAGSKDLDQYDSDHEKIWESDESNDGSDEHLVVDSSFVYMEATKRRSVLPTFQKSSLPRRALRHYPRKRPQTPAKEGLSESPAISNIEITPSDERQDEMKQADRSFEERAAIEVEEDRPFDE
jgi:hypothetical protein